MSTVLQIITKAFREAGIIEVGGTPEAEEATEALSLLQDLYLSLLGNEIGEDLVTLPLGNYSQNPSLTMNADVGYYILNMGFVPLNSRLLCNISSAKMLYLHPNPYDGARFAIVDNGDTFDTNTLTVNANGRKIAGATSVDFTTNAVTEYFYRADLGEWMQVTDLTLNSDSPLPREFDTLFSTILAFRLNPRYGAQSSDSMNTFMSRARRIARGRYRQIVEMSSDPALLMLANKNYYFLQPYRGYTLQTSVATDTVPVVVVPGVPVPPPPVATPLKTILSVSTSTNTAPSNTLTKYTPPCGGSNIHAVWNSSTSRPDTPVMAAGTFSNLYVRLPVALSAGQTWTFTLVKNGVDQPLSVTIDSTGLAKVDTTDTVDVVVGDKICFKSAPAGTPNAQQVVQIACLFTASSTNQISPMFTNFSSGTGTGYGALGSNSASTMLQNARQVYMPTAGKTTTVGVNLTKAPGVGQSVTVTIMKNGADVMTTTIADNNTSATVTGTINWAVTDLMEIRKDTTASSVAGYVCVGVDWQPTTAGETLTLAPGTGNFDSTSTIYQNLWGSAENASVTEADDQNLVPYAFTLTKWFVRSAVAPGTGKTRIVTLRKNGVDQSASITMQDAQTTANVSTSVTFAAGDLASWKEVPSSNPLASNPVSTFGVITVS